MNRNISLPSLPVPHSTRPHYIDERKNLPVIKENREEVVRSADLRRTRSNSEAVQEMLKVRNEAKGYRADYDRQKPIRPYGKENG
jgi:hypothetical protein